MRRPQKKSEMGRFNANSFAYVSFFVAALSLVTSMYQGYLNTRFVELIQSGVARIFSEPDASSSDQALR